MPESLDRSPVARNSGSLNKLGAPEPIAALNRVKILESKLPFTKREPLVDIRIHCPAITLTERVCPYLRDKVAGMLNQAQNSLPEGYKLRVGTALRTLNMQKSGWDGYHTRMKTENPQWPLSTLRRSTNKYYAPYDQPAPPGHCTGGAVDVGLDDPTGNSLDMIAPTEGWEAAYTWSEKISPEAKMNRMMMVEAMLGAGFSNCRDEYWHYSWGDSAWAVRVGEKVCPYGWTHSPICLEPNDTDAPTSNTHIETVRDWMGVPTLAHGFFTIPTDTDSYAVDTAQWSIGLFWANTIPVTLRINWPIALPIPTLYTGDRKETWQPIDDIQRENGVLIINLTPSQDKIYIMNRDYLAANCLAINDPPS